MGVVGKSLTLALGLSVCGVTGYLLYLFLKKDEDDDYLNPLYQTAKYHTVQFPVPKVMVKMLIGRSGKNIKEIEEQTKTIVEFGLHDKADPICTIRGTKEACSIAEQLIQEFIDNKPIIECEDIWVPIGSVGKIIGREGENIQAIRVTSGTKINIEGSKAGPTRRVAIKGTREQIRLAKSLLDDLVSEWAKNQMEMEAALSRREPRVPPKNGADSPKSTGSPKVERISPLPGQPDAQFEVYVSAMVDPSRFWLQIVGPKATELDVLVDEMTDYYRKEENRHNHVLNDVNKGDLVAAIFKYDNKWYRAEVLDIVNGDCTMKAELYYVDYGDTDLVPIEDLFELRTDFLRLHFQAIECFLARVEPVGGNWSEQAVDKFEEWTHVAQWQKLSAKTNGYCLREKTRAKREGSPVPGVDLFDVNNEQDVDIAQELVNHGYAVFKKDVDLRLCTPPSSTSTISVASSS